MQRRFRHRHALANGRQHGLAKAGQGRRQVAAQRGVRLDFGGDKADHGLQATTLRAGLAGERQRRACRQHIEGGRPRWQQDQIGQERRQERRIGKAWGRIDEDARRRRRGGAYGGLKALGAGGLDGRHARRQVPRAQPGPGHQALLRIRIEHRHGMAAGGEFGGKIGRERTLANAAFAARDRDNRHVLRSPGPCQPRRIPSCLQRDTRKSAA